MTTLTCLLPGVTAGPRETRHILNFINFHRNNPIFYQWLEDAACAAKDEGRTNFAIQHHVQEARWDKQVVIVHSIGSIKLSAAHAAFYSRLLMHRCNKLKGFFHLRPSMADMVDYSRV